MKLPKAKPAWTFSVPAIVGLGSMILSGCNVGNAPPPMSDKDVLNKVNSLSPQQQMDFVANASMPPSEKIKQIKAIETKTGVKDSKPYPSENQTQGAH